MTSGSASDALTQLAASSHYPTELCQSSFDVHLAVLCRKRSITLLTEDRDHDRIRPQVGRSNAAFPVA